MNDPVTDFINLFRPVLAAHCNDLERVLRGPLNWQSVDHKKAARGAVTNVVRVSHFWSAHQDGWHLAMTDFPIGDQPGHEPFDRGQNVTISKPDSGLPVLMSDGDVFHRLAKWLIDKMRARELHKTEARDAFVGQGSSPRIRTLHLPQTEAYTLNSVDRLDQAITWLDQHIRNLGSAVWVFETRPVHYRFDQTTKVATWWGETDEATNMVLKAMGWEVVPRDAGKQN